VSNINIKKGFKHKSDVTLDENKNLIEVNIVDTVLHKDDELYVKFVIKGGYLEVEMIEHPIDNHHQLQIINLKDEIHSIAGKMNIDFLGNKL
jgi:hypothetical protein